jgi:pSer/pThr/pTyr-binding forkhead associated (FHA) protein
MSVEPVLLALQALFLILLYVFIWRVIRSAARDLRVPQESFIMAPSQLAAAGASAPPAPAGRLVVASSSAVVKGNTYEAGPVPLTIGRAEDNTVALAGDDFASAHHARIEARRDGVWIVDLDSTNGTYVNGARLDGRRKLREGDVVQIGDTELRFER